MRIALVNRDFGIGTGTGGYTAGLAGWLAAQAHTVSVFASRVKGRIPEGVHLRRLPHVPGGVRGARMLAKMVDRQDFSGFDVVQSLDRVPGRDIYRAGGGAHAAWLRQRGRWGWRPSDRAIVRLEHLAAHTARVVVCNSVMAAHDVRRHLDVPAKRIRVVRNGVDTARFCPGPRERRQGRQVLFLGHGFRRKGLAVAYQAFVRVCGPEDRFVVAGADRRSEWWRRHLTDDRVIWVGPSRAPDRLLREADVLCAPTLYDSAANTALESLASGTPVVTSVFDGNSEVVPVSEWVVRAPRSVDNVAVALQVALEAGSAEREACVEVGRRWPTSRNGTVMEHLYMELLDG